VYRLTKKLPPGKMRLNPGMVWENQVSDLKWWQSEAAVRYGIQGIPAAFLLDKDAL